MLRDSQSTPLGWQDLYHSAVLECDPVKLPQRITKAREAIINRIAANGSTAYKHHEHQELSDAINGLRVLQQEYQRRIQTYGEPRQKLG